MCIVFFTAIITVNFLVFLVIVLCLWLIPTLAIRAD
jgi:hypothetical protein